MLSSALLSAAVLSVAVQAQLPPFETVTSTKYPYVVHKPEGSGNKGADAPLLFYLHDEDNDGPANDIAQHVIKSGPGLRLEDFAEGITDCGGCTPTTTDFLTVMPLAPEGTSSWDLAGVKDVLANVRKTQSFNKNKIICAGFKMGSTAIWDMILANPDLCSAATLVEGNPTKGANANFAALAKANYAIQHYPSAADQDTANAVQSALKSAGATQLTLNTDISSGKITEDNIWDSRWTDFMSSAAAHTTVAPGDAAASGSGTAAAGSSGGSCNGTASSNTKRGQQYQLTAADWAWAKRSFVSEADRAVAERMEAASMETEATEIRRRSAAGKRHVRRLSKGDH